MDETKANGQPQERPRLKFILTVECDPVMGSQGYRVDMENGFPLGVAANICDKVRQRIVNDQIAIEAQQMAMAQAQKIQPVSQLPPNLRRG
jgi:uncharacterized lipoprotein YajG